MDYDQIVEGRRREWDELKPEERRRQEKEAERQKRREEREAKAKTRTSYERMRSFMQDRAAEEDRALFRRTMRQSLMLVGGFVLVILVVYGGQALVAWRSARAYRVELASYEKVLLQGTMINDLKTPVGAMATWRDAWKKGDMKRLVSLFSSRFFGKLGRNRTYDDVVREYERLYSSGALETQAAIVDGFEGAEIVRIPDKPWTNGELALFRSPLVEKVGATEPTRYIGAFSYDATSGQWRFADFREAKFFSVKWTQESMITALSAGPNAATYDERGNLIFRDNMRGRRTF